ncbi:MAG: sodium:calcium antiporter [Promethearchaeota archaeon]
MLDIFLWIILLVGGITLVIFSSKIAVKNSTLLATALGISPLIIGVTLVSIGTDISEIFNSLISCARGHGDIDVGDSVGSDLAQLTLVFGLLPIICGAFYIHRKDIIILGTCELLSLLVIFSVVEKGYISRLDALFMVGSLGIYIWLIYNSNKQSIIHRIELVEIQKPEKKKHIYLLFAILAFLGVTIAATMIVESVINISRLLNVHEYIISFFILAIGTSLPELAVDINALRLKQHSIAVGDIVGSCIVDSTLSIGIGQVFFPQEVTASFAVPTVLFTIIVSFIVITTVAIRKKIDKKAGVFFIMVYFTSYVIPFLPIYDYLKAINLI